MTTSPIKPTIGRRVWFRPSAQFLERNPTVTQLGAGQPMDAGIVYVHHDHMVNLAVCDHVGRTHMVPSIPLLAGQWEPSDTDYAVCEWMPYQKGQAAKAEAAGKAVEAADSVAVPGDVQPLGVRIERSDGVTDMPYASLRAEMDGSVATICLNMDAIRAGGFFQIEAAREKPVAASHQQRVLAEKMDRDQEITRLDTFIRENPVFHTLPAAEQARLRRQLDVMHELSAVLGERIANF